MGKPTGFLDFERKTASYTSVKKRVGHYNEFSKTLPEKELATQGARCMDCGIPYCHAMGCPIYNLIPEWNDAVYRQDWKEAYERLSLTNNFPEITGRVCPAPCETSCTLSINTAPVSIKQIELAIIERAFKEGWVRPERSKNQTGKKVCVIGSGPAGLAAAQQLVRKGHSVTVFEKSDKIGGLLRYGIPNFKLEKWVIDRRLQQMEEEGIRFETSVLIGEDMSVRYLMRTFDALILALGAGKPRDLPVTGRGREGIHFAMDYLTLSNKFCEGELEESEIINARKKRVLIIGGGDTGSDCVGTAIRQGASEVYQFEIMAKPRVWKESWNPEWPNWPRILRTSTSQQEGCKRDWGIETLQFTGRSIRVEEVQFQRIQWGQDKATGRWETTGVPGSEFTKDFDIVLLAMGFEHVDHSNLLSSFGSRSSGMEFDDRGNIRTDDCYQTSVPSVFATGDAKTGASLIVQALYHGRRTAESVHEYLTQ
jgi:glutamate synthase (NADPH) small chain